MRKLMFVLVIVMILAMQQVYAMQGTVTHEPPKVPNSDVLAAVQVVIPVPHELSCPDNVLRIIKSNCARHGMDWKIIYPLVGCESGFKQDQVFKTRREYSMGLLQVNILTNFDGEDSSKLLDGDYNLDYQLDNLTESYQKGIESGLNGVKLIQYISKHGQRADWKDEENAAYMTKSIAKYWKEVKDCGC